MRFIERLKQIFNTKNHKHEIIYEKGLAIGVSGAIKLKCNVNKVLLYIISKKVENYYLVWVKFI